MISWRIKVPKLCGTKGDVDDAWTYHAPQRFPFTCMLWASVSALNCHSWYCLPSYYIVAKTSLSVRHEGEADTRAGYVCECGVVFVTCVSDIMPYAESLIAWHFIAFNVSLCSSDNSRQKCDEVKEVWKSVTWGFFCFGGEVTQCQLPNRVLEKKRQSVKEGQQNCRKLPQMPVQAVFTHVNTLPKESKAYFGV